MQINFEEFNKWIAALRSGEYKQGYGQLESDDSCFCCLGVGCKVMIPSSDQKIDQYGRLIGGFAKSQTDKYHWFGYLPQDFHARTGMGITTLNDQEEFTFDEIADVLELVYVHKILG